MNSNFRKRSPLLIAAVIGFAGYGLWNIGQALLWGDGSVVQDAYKPIILYVQVPWGLANLGIAWWLWRSVGNKSND
ncbi:MAG: hypothetical protein RL410_1043 [Actinomycetota bacterium]